MGAIKALLNSEKAVTGGVLVIAATVLVAIGKMPVSMWGDYTQLIFGVYVGGKTVQGAVAAITAKMDSTTKPEAKESV